MYGSSNAIHNFIMSCGPIFFLICKNVAIKPTTRKKSSYILLGMGTCVTSQRQSFRPKTSWSLGAFKPDHTIAKLNVSKALLRLIGQKELDWSQEPSLTHMMLLLINNSIGCKCNNKRPEHKTRMFAVWGKKLRATYLYYQRGCQILSIHLCINKV